MFLHKLPAWPGPRRWAFLTAAALYLGFAGVSPWAANGLSQSGWRTVRIASEGARPPYNYLDHNELAGFEIDLARDLCARMKVTCSFVIQDWDDLIPGLLAHHYDAIFAALEINDENRKKIAFSKPYVRMPSAFLVLKQEEQPIELTPAGLAGRSIGVEASGAQEGYVNDVFKQSQIRPYATLEDAILDLAEGQLDTVLASKDALIDYIKHRKEAECCVLAGDVPHLPDYFGEGIGIGLRQDDKTLKAMFDKALDSCMADGSFARIRAKYFDFKIN